MCADLRTTASTAPAAQAPPDLGPAVAHLRATGVPLPMDLDVHVTPTPGATLESFYLTMRDGVRIAIDLHQPPLELGEQVPTCLRSTRYWRASVDDPIRNHLNALEAARWTAHGFALVLVDARGTGASFGTWRRAWDDDQRDDLSEIVDWIISQPWSDQKVGGYGTSYDGTTAHLLAATRHPAVKAVVPRFALFDAYHHIAAPGGVPQDGFTSLWDAMNWALDGHPDRATVRLPIPLQGSVRPADRDPAMLAAAVAEHAGNVELARVAQRVECRDDRMADDGADPEDGTPLGRIDDLRAAHIPMWIWSAWYDGAYAAAALAQLADPELNTRVTIGPFAHGAAYHALGDPLLPQLQNDSMDDQVEQIAAYLRAPDSRPRLRYYRLGDGWQESETWPPASSVMDRVHLGADGLTATPSDAARTYEVDFDARCDGAVTRWQSLLGGSPVNYPDRRHADERLLVWDGPELRIPTGITGTPVAHLELTASAPDAAIHLYLEAVRPDGSVLYITEGQLRASHRTRGTGRAPYETFGPWHSHLRADVTPLVPERRAVLDFALWPISVLLPAGWRLRVALAGADAGWFRRIPAEGDVELTVHGVSWIDLPTERGV